MNTVFIKPARPGVLLRDPATGETIPPEGAAIVMGAHRAYWLRRVKDGDAVISPAKETPAVPTGDKVSKEHD